MNEKKLNALEDIMGRLVCCQAVFQAIHMNMAADDIHAAALCGACDLLDSIRRDLEAVAEVAA